MQILHRDVLVFERYAPDGIENHPLYHYCSIDTLASILSNKSLRFSDVRFLNDTTEFQEAVSFYLSYIREHKAEYSEEFISLISHEDFIQKLRNYEQHYYLKNSKDQPVNGEPCITYTCSFCLDGDSLPMWNYYADSGSG